MDLQIRLRTSRLDMILDILSRTTIYLIYSRCLDRPYCIPHSNALLSYPYCPLDTIVFLSHTLIVLSFLLFRIQTLSFVLSWTLTRYCIVQNKSTQMYKQCNLYALIPQFLLTHCGIRLGLFSVITVPSHSLWYQPALPASVHTIHCALHSPCQLNPVTSPDVSTCCSS